MKQLSVVRFFGMNPSVSPHALKEGYAEYALNARLGTGALEAFRETCESDAVCKPCEATASPPCGGVVKVRVVNNTLVHEDGTRVDPKNVGTAPTIATVLTDETKARRSATVFRYTLVDAKGAESTPSMPSELVDVREGDKIVLGGMPPGTWRLYAYTSRDAAETAKPTTDSGVWLVVGDYQGTSRLITVDKTRWALVEGAYDPDDLCNLPEVDCVAYLDSGYYVTWKRGATAFYISARNDVTKWPRRSIFGTQSPIRDVFTARGTIYVATDDRSEMFTVAPANTLTGIGVTHALTDEAIPAVGESGLGAYASGAVFASRFGLMALSPNGEHLNLTQNIIRDDEFSTFYRGRGIAVRGYYFSVDTDSGWVYDMPDQAHGQHEGGAFVYIDEGAQSLCRTGGRAVFVRDTATVLWDCGPRYKKAIWRSQIFRAKAYVRWAYVKLQGVNIGEGVTVRVILDGVVKHELKLSGLEPCVLPVHVCGTDTQIEVELPSSTKRISVTGVHLATSKLGFNA